MSDNKIVKTLADSANKAKLTSLATDFIYRIYTGNLFVKELFELFLNHN